MPDPAAPSSAIKKWLRTELATWAEEFLVSPEQAAKLSARYNLDAPEQHADRFAAVLYVLAGILIGGGIISFIAFNWMFLPASVKVVGLLSIMLALQGVGYYYWKVAASRPRLGHGLVVLGVFLFGANIGLIAQIFNLPGSFAGGFGAWAFGATIMAYLWGSAPVAAVGIIAANVWFFGGALESETLWSYPILVAIQAFPFAMIHDSRSVFVLGLAGFVSGLLGLALIQSGPLTAVVACCAVSALLVVAGTVLLTMPGRIVMARACLLLGGMVLTFTLYASTIVYVIEMLQKRIGPESTPAGAAPFLVGLTAVMAAIFAGPVMLRLKSLPGLAPFLFTTLGIAMAMPLLIIFGDTFIAWSGMNLAMLLLACVMVWTGIAREYRAAYWGGVLALALLFITRFAFMQSNMLMKSAAFTGTGIAVLIAGMYFERLVRARKDSHA